jgi:hypothetical protein
MSSTRLATLIATLSLAAVPAGAGASLDYSMNSVSGQYTPPIARQINDVPSVSDRAPSHVAGPAAPRAVVVSQPESGFSWGDALIGASVALLLAFAGIAVARRRHPAPLAD